MIDPDEESVLVYRQPTPDRCLKPSDQLEGEDVLPGFSMPVADWIFEII